MSEGIDQIVLYLVVEYYVLPIGDHQPDKPRIIRSFNRLWKAKLFIWWWGRDWKIKIAKVNTMSIN